MHRLAVVVVLAGVLVALAAVIIGIGLTASHTTGVLAPGPHLTTGRGVTT
jgi:hypothetical protein